MHAGGLRSAARPQGGHQDCTRATALLSHATSPLASLQISKLKGVGPATASAVLAAGAPEQAPFFDSPMARAVQRPPLGKVEYNVKFYVQFAERLRHRCEELNSRSLAQSGICVQLTCALWRARGSNPGSDFTPQDLSQALWCTALATVKKNRVPKAELKQKY